MTRKLTDKQIEENVWDAGQWDISFEVPRWGWSSPSFLIRQIHPAKQHYRLATGLTWSDPQPIDKPILDAIETFRLRHQTVQDLFDQMWQSGLRPSDPKDPQAHDALKAHLADMRELALNVLMPMIKGRWDAQE